MYQLGVVTFQSRGWKFKSSLGDGFLLVKECHSGWKNHFPQLPDALFSQVSGHV